MNKFINSFNVPRWHKTQKILWSFILEVEIDDLNKSSYNLKDIDIINQWNFTKTPIKQTIDFMGNDFTISKEGYYDTLRGAQYSLVKKYFK